MLQLGPVTVRWFMGKHKHQHVNFDLFSELPICYQLLIQYGYRKIYPQFYWKKHLWIWVIVKFYQIVVIPKSVLKHSGARCRTKVALCGVTSWICRSIAGCSEGSSKLEIDSHVSNVNIRNASHLLSKNMLFRSNLIFSWRFFGSLVHVGPIPFQGNGYSCSLVQSGRDTRLDGPVRSHLRSLRCRVCHGTLPHPHGRLEVEGFWSIFPSNCGVMTRLKIDIAMNVNYMMFWRAWSWCDSQDFHFLLSPFFQPQLWS